MYLDFIILIFYFFSHCFIGSLYIFFVWGIQMWLYGWIKNAIKEI